MRNHIRRSDRKSILVKAFPTEWICSVCGETLPISSYQRYLHSEKDGVRTFSFDPFCKNCKRLISSQYLGITVTEKVLSKVFPKVKRMPYGNPGYDFICGKGFKVDAKAACYNQDGFWTFSIRYNKIADYFACLAFDNRSSLKPLHFWLIPGNAMLPFGKGSNDWREKKKRPVNRFFQITINPNTLDKWQEYEKPVDTVLTSCNLMKSTLSYFMRV